MTSLAQVAWEASQRRNLSGDLRNAKEPGHRTIWGQGGLERGNSKCKGPEAEKRLSVTGRERRKVYWELKGRKGVLEMRSKREVRKALKT